MAAARDIGDLFDWPRREAVAAIEERRRVVRDELALCRPRSERFFALRMKLRELTEEELRVSCEVGHV